jgi:hypothetical protein
MGVVGLNLRVNLGVKLVIFHLFFLFFLFSIFHFHYDGKMMFIISVECVVLSFDSNLFHVFALIVTLGAVRRAGCILRVSCRPPQNSRYSQDTVSRF